VPRRHIELLTGAHAVLQRDRVEVLFRSLARGFFGDLQR
jgi:hypothetical protein